MDYIQKAEVLVPRQSSEPSDKLLMENQLLAKRIFSEFALPVPNYHNQGFMTSVGLDGLVAAIDTINAVY